MLAGSAAAQHTATDYVVTAAGDTLRGRIQLVGKHAQLIRLYRPGMPAAEFSANQARSYGDASEPIGISKTVGPHGTPQFVRPLVQGYVTLYGGENAQGDKRYYLQPTDSTYLIEVPPSTARLTFHRLLAGCSSLDFGDDATVRQYPYNYSGMTRLIMAYNTCRQPSQPSKLAKATSGLRASFGLKAGLNWSDFSLSATPYEGNHTQAIGYQGGAFLHFTTKTRFSVQVEATYLALRSNYGPTDAYTGTSLYSATSSVSIRYSQVQMPLLLRYTLGYGNVRPYINAGPSYGLNFKNQSATIRQRSDQAQAEHYTLGHPDRSSLGWVGGVGLLIDRPALPILSVEARFDKLVDGLGYIAYTPHHNTFRLDLGIAF
ncbi:porin family protein [Hymenobacter sp. GOD-10R]|uniref:porin family protein n=1 Tax=Hymenobacter sp. GOD-10R TaxID=3093922 RepID=UPI002D777992|nr:porin family protein [Hymenobacter sp. GOD-10R]WRQ30220.1 porin family protein [Hymenobacter sp. GOD-10R]